MIKDKEPELTEESYLQVFSERVVAQYQASVPALQQFFEEKQIEEEVKVKKPAVKEKIKKKRSKKDAYSTEDEKEYIEIGFDTPKERKPKSIFIVNASETVDYVHEQIVNAAFPSTTVVEPLRTSSSDYNLKEAEQPPEPVSVFTTVPGARIFDLVKRPVPRRANRRDPNADLHFTLLTPFRNMHVHSEDVVANEEKQEEERSNSPINVDNKGITTHRESVR
jgi:hypothetical protein